MSGCLTATALLITNCPVFMLILVPPQACECLRLVLRTFRASGGILPRLHIDPVGDESVLMRVGHSVRRQVPLLLVCAFVVTACATGYQPMGFSGGYSDVRLDSNTFQVSFRGNGYTSRQTVETFALYRCAELTAQAGFDTFVIVGGDTQAAPAGTTAPAYADDATLQRVNYFRATAGLPGTVVLDGTLKRQGSERRPHDERTGCAYPRTAEYLCVLSLAGPGALCHSEI